MRDVIKEATWRARLVGETNQGDESLIGCRVFASYAISFDSSAEFIDTAITGTLEGVIVCECEMS